MPQVLIVHSGKFFEGFIISDMVQLILPLMFRFEVILLMVFTVNEG